MSKKAFASNVASDILDVVIIDDNEIIRKGISFAIEEDKNIRVVNDLPGNEVVLDELVAINPHVLIIDMDMLSADGLALIKAIKQSEAKTKVLAMSNFKDATIFDDLILVGAEGCVLQEISSQDLQRAIFLIASGKKYFSEDLLPLLTSRIFDRKEEKEKVKISKREREVLSLIAKGHSSQEIAYCLNISKKTVANHRASLNFKAGVKNTAGLMAFAVKNNLIEAH